MGHVLPSMLYIGFLQALNFQKFEHPWQMTRLILGSSIFTRFALIIFGIIHCYLMDIGHLLDPHA